MKRNISKFFKDFACGAAIGTAMIIPGVSGGTIAVLTDTYDKIIGAISNIIKDFKNSFFVLAPVLLGAVAAFAAMYVPLKYALQYAPLPTAMLFGGLMLGTMPLFVKDCAKRGFKATDAIAVILPLAFIICICFIPESGNVNLGEDMSAGMYFALIGVGVLGSCALVIPGISGSMLLLILGFYQPVLDTVSLLFTNFGHSAVVLLLFVLGVVIGFFTIAKLMKFLLSKFTRATYWAIAGFVAGSIPALFISFPSNFPQASYDTVQIVIGVIVALAGALGAFAFSAYAQSKLSTKQSGENAAGDTGPTDG